MATSGFKSVAVTSWDTLKFSWSIKSQSVANNTSTVSWKLELIATSSGRISSTASKDWSVTVNGTKYSGTNTIGISNNATKTLASGTTTIKHNEDGTKTFSYSFSQEIAITFSGDYIGTKSGSGSGPLTAISRKSTLTASNGTLGTAQALTINRNSSSFTHTIKYTCGSASGTVCTKLPGEIISFTPPLSLASQNTTGTSVSIKLTITTYSGSTSLGSNTKTITCSIPSSVKPTCHLAVGNTNTVGLPVFVKGISKFGIQVSATKAYGSDIASYSVKANGVTYTTAKVTTSVLSSSGNMTVTATVTDKRGRSDSSSMTFTVYDKSTLSTVNGTLGSQVYLQISSGYSGFKHTITYSCGSASGTVATKTSEKVNIPFELPMSLARQNTTGTTVPVKLTITTYCDDINIGTNTKTITCSMPESVKPSVSIGISDTTGVWDKYGALVKGLSNLKVSLSTTASYDSPIASYSTTVGKNKYTTDSIDAGLITSTNKIPIKATVTDKRGRTGISEIEIDDILNYSSPTVSNLTVGRCDEDGTANDGGSYVKVTYSATVTSLNNKNSASYVLKYKKTSASSYTTVKNGTFDSSYSLSDQTYIFAADTGSSYNVQLAITDDFSTTTKTATASTAFTIMHFHKDGQGMSIGKVSEDSFKEYFDIALHTLLRNNGYLCGLTTDGVVNRMLYVNASNNTILGFGGYSLGYGTTNIYGQRVNFGVKVGGVKDGVAAFFKPYYETGDVIENQTINTAGYVTSSKTEVYFVIPLSKPVIGNPTVTISSTNGLTLRQNGEYTHGSSSSTGTVPDSYTATLFTDNIRVKASFTNTTNAINNNPIGIGWSGNIIFE